MTVRHRPMRPGDNYYLEPEPTTPFLLRLPVSLKARIADLAAADEVSVNTWITDKLSKAAGE